MARFASIAQNRRKIGILPLMEAEGSGCRAATPPPVSVARAERVLYGIRNHVRLLRLTLGARRSGRRSAASLPKQSTCQRHNPVQIRELRPPMTSFRQCDARVVQFIVWPVWKCTPFPLTPALSLGERGNCFQSLGKSTAAFCSVALNNKNTSNGCSLYPRERVRVRGNRIPELPTRWLIEENINPADTEFIELL